MNGDNIRISCERCGRVLPLPQLDYCALDPLKAFDEGAEHARIQRIATIAQLAHEWAKARRARLVFTYPPFRECESPIPEGPESGETPCLHTHEVLSERDLRPDMCPPCREAAEAIIERRKLAAKLSGLSARLERACLGPREKKGASDV